MTPARAGGNPGRSRRAARTRISLRSSGLRISLRFDIGGAGGLGPVLEIGRDRALKLRWRAARGRKALLGEFGDEVGIAQRAIDLAIDPLDHLARRARGGEQSDPLDRLEAGK